MFGTGGFQFNSPQQKTTTSNLTFGTANPIMTTPSLQSMSGGSLPGTMFSSSFTTSASPMFRGLNTTTSTLAPTTSIFSGLQPKSTSMPVLGFGFGTGSTTTSAPTTLNLGLGSTLPVSSVPAATTANVGLGGVDLSQTSTGLAGRGVTSGQSDSKAAVKETVLPNEISETLETFKKYVKEQKIIREEITRVSSKLILKVQKETAALKQMLSVVSNGLQRNAVAIEKLKLETSQELKNAEIAQRTKDTPPALQYENVAPTEYFQQLVANFERQMQSYRQQIEQLEKHLTSISHPALLTPQELTAVMKRLHETFVALASNLQVIHDAVQHQKEQFLCYRRLLDGDNSNIFQVRNRENRINRTHISKIPVTVGPAPFSNTPSPAAIAMATALNRTQQPTGGPSSIGTPHNQGSIGTGGFCSGGLGTGLGTGSFGTQSSMFSGPSLNFGSSSAAFKPLGSFSSGSMFGTSGFGPLAFGSQSSADATPQTPYPVSNQSKPFQLQKPPMGNKRGKRWTST